MRRAFAVLATAALALSLTGGAFAAGKDDGPPYHTDATGCRDVHGHLVGAAKCKAPPAAPPAAKASTGAAMASSTTSGAKPKQCKKGKPCGNTCISMKDVCHK